MSKATSTNSNLNKASKAKNDEFYTMIGDIEDELSHYTHHFKDKVVYCNCDHHYKSNFVKYFALNFSKLGLKRLVATHYTPNSADLFNPKGNYDRPVKWVYNGEQLDDNIPDLSKAIVTDLKGDGDFRSEECIETLKQCDIVVTNPPFSLFREYIKQLIEYNKKLLIIGSQNAISYQYVFDLVKDNKLWVGCNNVKGFLINGADYKSYNKNIKWCNNIGGYIAKFGNISWFTNMEHNKRHQGIALTKKYNKEDYPKYDNYNAINVDRVKDIPYNYNGFMGVPITFMNKYNPKQFKIINNSNILAEAITVNGKVVKKPGRFYVNSERLYERVVIKRVRR